MKALPVLFIFALIAAGAALAGCTGPVQAPDRLGTGATAAPAMAPAGSPPVPADGTGRANLTGFVQDAAAYAREHGKDAAIVEFNRLNGTFTRGDRYIFAYGMDGTTLAWPARPEMIGTNRAGAADPNGVRHIARMIGLAQEGGGYLYYVTQNPAAGNREEFKIAYVLPVDGTWFIGSGIYLPEVPARFTAGERDALVARVEQAREFARQHGTAGAIAAFNDRNSSFADGSRYVFAYGYNGTTLALPFQPEIVGTGRMNFTDTYGVKVTAWETAVAKAGGGFVYVHYLNPETGTPGAKLCYVAPAGEDWFAGSGIYAAGR